jgi:inosose dehydratase
VRSELKIAGAPISWGVCEVPGWGHQMSPERVLKEMSDLGLTATEFGPLGFLPITPQQRAQALAKYNMIAVGGFFPIVLHDEKFDPLPEVKTELESFIASNAKVLVLAASTGQSDYEAKRPELTSEQWNTFFRNCDRISEYANSIGILATIHPHVGTMIETFDDVHRLVNGSNIAFTLDTGHMIIGGTDPVEFTKKYANRIKHAHLKDVDMAKATKVASGEQTYNQGVKAGMYTPLGKGDVDIKSIVESLLESGYDGWFVFEQDLMLDAEPAPGGWPFTDVKESIDYLFSITSNL